MNYEITDTITAEEYMEMRKAVGWETIPYEQAADGLKHTAHLCCFKKDGKTVALARILWDYGYIIYIADVIVRPEYQRQGLGHALMAAVMEYIKSMLKPGYKVKVNLMSAKGKEAFYKDFGFIARPDETSGCGMHQWIEA